MIASTDLSASSDAGTRSIDVETIVGDVGERRRSPRRLTTLSVSLSNDLDADISAEVADLNESGACVWTAVALSEGEEAMLVFGVGSCETISVEGVVVTCQTSGNDVWRVGVHFLRRLSAIELASVLN